ncbi:MAG: hypothetical protein KDA80_21895, partial [Planctomycetaceae bacterium]|nr:hypothetical protein [Planctomycetaceae bacterium]
MRRRLIRSTFLFATTWGVMVGVGPWLPSQGHIVAQDRDHATIASTRSDAYLLGLVGTAHVLVVHDYLGALVEQ